jgi:imidazole glycerol phosphate synthase glutamine amidotransferase subunit
MKVAIIDCGSGNLQSIKNALDYLGVENEMTFDKEAIQKADGVIFPGQGHFGKVMQQLTTAGKRGLILECIQHKPFLGICVGMQLLFDSSEEAPAIKGLGVIAGSVRRFSTVQKIPQMGWNQVKFKKSFLQLESGYFYFANSYYCEPADPSVIVATTDYGTNFPSIIKRNQLVAVQFHPEKSGEAGLNFLEAFVRDFEKIS